MQQRWCSGHAEQQRQPEEECVPAQILAQGQLEQLNFAQTCQVSYSELTRLAFCTLKKVNGASSNTGRDGFKTF
jgi:hypothetical protein